jgi:hypothetical protein
MGSAEIGSLRFGVNLRGDLAKIGDGELAGRLQSHLDDREALAARAGDAATGGCTGMGRECPLAEDFCMPGFSTASWGSSTPGH